MTPEIVNLITEQTGHEYAASGLYGSLSQWASQNGFPGTYKYFQNSSTEEREHMYKFIDFMNEFADVRLPIPQVDGVSADPGSLLAAFNMALNLELKVTKLISNITDVAAKAGSWEVVQFMNWFNEEQITSVSEIRNIVKWLTNAGDDTSAKFQVDEMIGELVE